MLSRSWEWFSRFDHESYAVTADLFQDFIMIMVYGILVPLAPVKCSR